VWQESLYDLWCRESNFAVVYPSSYGPVAYACGITKVNGTKTNTSTVTSKSNAVFIWNRSTPRRRQRLHRIEHDQCCYCFCISYLTGVKPIIYEKPNIVLKVESMPIICYYLVIFSSLSISVYKCPLYKRAPTPSIVQIKKRSDSKTLKR
jgi:hypothetical protein